MKHLSNHWRFLPSNPHACCIDFFVDFEFRSVLLQKLSDLYHQNKPAAEIRIITPTLGPEVGSMATAYAVGDVT